MYYAEYAGQAPQFFTLDGPLELEGGGQLPEVTIAYHTYGTLNATGDNVLWVCHALTANSDVADWWPNTVVEGGLLDPSKYFIVCANKLGSPYGSTSPISPNPAREDEPYFLDFPQVTVRDMVRAFQPLRRQLGITKIHMIIGGSTGGCQAMEWAILEPELFEHVALTVTLPKTTPWIVADSEAQRMAIESDLSFYEPVLEGGGKGLAAARAMSMLIYRNSVAFNRTQKDEEEKLTDYRAASYQRYQGEKLRKRFNTHCYYRLLQSLDSHDVGRGRGGVMEALKQIQAKTIVMAVDTDIMFTEPEVREMAGIIRGGQNDPQEGADYYVIHSDYGHDGFLIETPEITKILKAYL